MALVASFIGWQHNGLVMEGRVESGVQLPVSRNSIITQSNTRAVKRGM